MEDTGWVKKKYDGYSRYWQREVGRLNLSIYKYGESKDWRVIAYFADRGAYYVDVINIVDEGGFKSMKKAIARLDEKLKEFFTPYMIFVTGGIFDAAEDEGT